MIALKYIRLITTYSIPLILTINISLEFIPISNKAVVPKVPKNKITNKIIFHFNNPTSFLF